MKTIYCHSVIISSEDEGKSLRCFATTPRRNWSWSSLFVCFLLNCSISATPRSALSCTTGVFLILSRAAAEPS